MKEALKEARKAIQKEEVPIGAVIVKDGKVIAMKWMGEWYYPRKDYSGRDWMYGSWYIASDVCDNCALEKYCKANNPINHACEEADQSEINWH